MHLFGRSENLPTGYSADFLNRMCDWVAQFFPCSVMLLRRYRDVTLTFLTGLMLGTLPKIWPWKETLSWRVNSSGEQVPLLQRNYHRLNLKRLRHSHHSGC